MEILKHWKGVKSTRKFSPVRAFITQNNLFPNMCSIMGSSITVCRKHSASCHIPKTVNVTACMIHRDISDEIN